MAPTSKAAGSNKGPRKSAGAADKTQKLVTLKVSPARLRDLNIPATATRVKEESPNQDVKASASSSDAGDAIKPPSDNALESSPATPAAGGTPAPSVMGPPGEGQGPKRRGPKRAAPNGDAADGKARARPGPKKRQRMDDGTIEPRPPAAAHRLGPKANQGAINDRLRALDRTGTPCRKWQRGGFKLKSFTGVTWEIGRWKAPPKPDSASSSTPEEASVSASADGDSNSNKENGTSGKVTNGVLKSQDKSHLSASGDVEMQSAPSIPASSPARMPVAAGA